MAIFDTVPCIVKHNASLFAPLNFIGSAYTKLYDYRLHFSMDIRAALQAILIMRI